MASSGEYRGSMDLFLGVAKLPWMSQKVRR
jgi:hypothetical protein